MGCDERKRYFTHDDHYDALGPRATESPIEKCERIILALETTRRILHAHKVCRKGREFQDSKRKKLGASERTCTRKQTGRHDVCTTDNSENP